jgi:hypothetical protein
MCYKLQGTDVVKTKLDQAEEQGPTLDLVRNSLLFRELTAEHEEVLKHKWIESEKIGHDIGLGIAQVDWNLKYRSQWRKERREHHHLCPPS